MIVKSTDYHFDDNDHETIAAFRAIGRRGALSAPARAVGCGLWARLVR